jgi:hypothetical protein
MEALCRPFRPDVQHAPQTALSSTLRTLSVLSGRESVRGMHATMITVHICSDLALDAGHNIAKCSNGRA